jgi:hypothetical protein
MWPAFPTSDYYEGSAPPRANSRQRACPRQAGSPGWFPRSSPTDRRGRRPAFPLQPRHEYAADLPHGPRASHEILTPESPTPSGAGVHCSSAQIRQVGADAALEGVQTLVRFRYTFPSRLPGTGRLAVPARPVVVGAAPARTLRFQGQAAPSFNDPLRRVAVGSLIPLGQSTPRGALRARSATGQVARAANEKGGLAAHRAKPACPSAFSHKAPVPVARR